MDFGSLGLAIVTAVIKVTNKMNMILATVLPSFVADDRLLGFLLDGSNSCCGGFGSGGSGLFDRFNLVVLIDDLHWSSGSGGSRRGGGDGSGG